jgi:hypothetical protein
MELRSYLANGNAEAFRHLLKAPLLTAIEDSLMAYEKAYADLARLRHTQIEDAKNILRGTEHEYRVERGTPDGERLRAWVADQRRISTRGKELWVSRSGRTIEAHYRIDLDRFPNLLFAQEQLLRHGQICREAAAIETEMVLREYGPSAFDDERITASLGPFGAPP